MSNNFKKIGCIILFACMWFVRMDAQTGQAIVKGKIVDSKTKEAIEGASVSELDPDGRIIKGAATDIEGNFVLRITNPRHQVSVSYVGYKTTSVGINGRQTINFQLVSGSSDLQEVVVVASRGVDNGMGSKLERNLTTSVAKIDAKNLEEMASASIDQALQGRLAGVDITATSGDPGAAMNIRIRGVSSINSTGNPLIVVDGMPYDTEIPGDFNFGTADEQGYAQLLNISPADIKDITVLKDAAATAVWGSRAANGVLVITTKRGVRGKPSITYTVKGSTSLRPSAIPMLNGDQYSTLIPEIYMNRLGTTLNPQTTREFNYDPNDPYWYYNYSNNTHWVDAITRTGYLQDHTLSMTGGGEKAKYFASIGYFDQVGVTLGTALKRINTRINLDYTISEKIKIFTSIAYTHTVQDRNYADNLRDVAYRKMPNMSIYEYDAFGNLTPNYFSPASNIQGAYGGIGSGNRVGGTINPLSMASMAKFGVLGERVIPRFQVDYSIIKGLLRATFDVQFDINNTKNNSFLPQIATGRPNTETVVNRTYNGDIDVFGITTRTNLGFTPKLKNDNHRISSNLNIFTSDSKSVNQEITTSNTASSLLVDPAAPSRTQNADLKSATGIGQHRTVSAVIVGNYSYKDKYLFEVTLRGDGDSRFGANYRYGVFPGASFAWRISDEKLFKNVKQLDDFRFRLSYALAGNAPGKDYTFFNTYNTYGWSYQDQSGVFPARMELKNLRWETVHGANTGFNISLFKGRLRSDVDFYRNRTKDLFFDNLQISSFTGFNSVNMNVGTMDNQGWEVAVFTQPYKTKNVTVGFDFNISANQNIIREISEFYPSSKGDVARNGEYMRLLQINNPFGSFYGYKYKGVYADKSSTIAQGANSKPIVGPTGQTIYMRFNY
ncbi:MAG TPA: SusC/RagA family TonB-linked outer membrane protein, partial [Segetibacter sp.]